MKTKPLSASSIKTFIQCALKYYFRYVDKKPRETENPDSLALGTAVHAALEYMYHLVKEKDRAPTPEEYADIYRVFMNSAASQGLSDLSLYQHGKDMLKERIDQVSPSEKVLGLELKFELETPNGTPYMGAIDKIVELDSQTLVVVDYKTSKTALSQDEADVDEQLSMYDLAASKLFPGYKTIILVFDYIKLKDQVITHRTKEQRQLFSEFLDAVYNAISTLKDEDVAPKLNQFCGWCEFKNFCPEYARAVSDPDIKLPRLDSLTEEELVNAWVKLQDIRRAVGVREESMKDELSVRSRNKDVEVLQGDTFELYKQRNPRTSYNTKAVFKIIPDSDLSSIVSINSDALNRYIIDNPQYREAIEKTTSKTQTAAFFKMRKRK